MAKRTAAQRRESAAKAAATRRKKKEAAAAAAKKGAEDPQPGDDASEEEPGPNPTPASTATHKKDIKPDFGGYLDIGGDPATLVAVPSLQDFPETLTEEVKMELAKSKAKCIDYDLPMNYGYLPLHEVVDKNGERFSLPWWDESQAGELRFVEPKPRSATPAETQANENFIGKTYKEITLFYSLTAEKMNNETLAEILGFRLVKHVYQHMTCVGK